MRDKVEYCDEIGVKAKYGYFVSFRIKNEYELIQHPIKFAVIADTGFRRYKYPMKRLLVKKHV